MYTDGWPLMIVVSDGSWAKRSYKNNYNSLLSEVPYIIGHRTEKILFLGVRNSYCCICDSYKSKKKTELEHICYKNWTESTGAMLADKGEGFCVGVAMHSSIKN